MTEKEELALIKDVKKFTDDRGTIDQIYNCDLPFVVKRMYRIKPLKGVIRAFHGHKEEWKAFIILKGIVKFVLYPIDIYPTEVKDLKTLVLREDDKIIIVPPKYYNGFMALTDDVDMIGLSSSTLEESKKDDFRKDPLLFGESIWKTKAR